MKKLLWIFLSVLISGHVIAQNDTTRRSGVLGKLGKMVDKYSGSSLSNDQVVSGLKEALAIGAERSTGKLSAPNGYLANAAVKILMPPEAQKVEKTLRTMGLGNQVDQAIVSMNRAAEDAAKSAAPIFIQAVKTMSIQDAVGILRGSDTSATAYLRSRTTMALTEAFRPTIERSLDKVEATKYWNTVFSAYNKVALKKVNPDLTAYVTERALQGIFLQLGQEEKLIRKDPAARSTEMLRKVFAN